MDAYKAPQFIYNPSPRPEPDDAFSGLLEIRIHHARNIHNICIYDNQDVYAKFSLTYNPDDTISTRIVNGGGKNPDFNEDLIMKIDQADAVLKCEIWMMSRAKSFMDDQLLGFVLVPISSLFGKGKVTQDFDLSSTDLFHSPAGTIRLSLFLNAKSLLKSPVFPDSIVDVSAKTSELLMDKKITVQEFSNVEFPDMCVVNENQQMVSEYVAKNGPVLSPMGFPWLGKPDGSFLHLGPGAALHEDYEMAGNSSDEYRADSGSQDGSIQNSGILSSTMTSLSDADSKEKKSLSFTDFSTSPNDNTLIVAETPTPTSNKNIKAREENGPDFLEKEEESEKEVNKHGANLVRNMKIEADDQSVMQQQIVDMYMRSMQQFTESLAKMKLPMDLDKVPGDDQGDVIQNPNKKTEVENKKDNSRVFYGSRAFF